MTSSIQLLTIRAFSASASTAGSSFSSRSSSGTVVNRHLPSNEGLSNSTYIAVLPCSSSSLSWRTSSGTPSRPSGRRRSRESPSGSSAGLRSSGACSPRRERSFGSRSPTFFSLALGGLFVLLAWMAGLPESLDVIAAWSYLRPARVQPSPGAPARRRASAAGSAVGRKARLRLGHEGRGQHRSRFGFLMRRSLPVHFRGSVQWRLACLHGMSFSSAASAEQRYLMARGGIRGTADGAHQPDRQSSKRAWHAWALHGRHRLDPASHYLSGC